MIQGTQRGIREQPLAGSMGYGEGQATGPKGRMGGGPPDGSAALQARQAGNWSSTQPAVNRSLANGKREGTSIVAAARTETQPYAECAACSLLVEAELRLSIRFRGNNCLSATMRITFTLPYPRFIRVSVLRTNWRA